MKCLICGENDANKKNSHLIPSFLVADFCSYDGSKKRDKEVMFTITPYEEKVYTGQIPDTKIEELFDPEALSEERITNELSNNPVSEDYIFCPRCEKRLSDYLETPYAAYLKRGENISCDVKYVFWVSVIWRASISKKFGFKLPSELEIDLQHILHSYLEAKDTGEDIGRLFSSCPFNYRILRCNKDTGKGFTYFIYNQGVLSCIIGNLVVVVSFNGRFPDDYQFFGIEEYIKKAHDCNIDYSEELFVESEVFEMLTENFKKYASSEKLKHEIEKVEACWKAVGFKGAMPLPIRTEFLKRLYSEDSKLGDRHSKERYVQLFNEVLQSFGYLPRE